MVSDVNTIKMSDLIRPPTIIDFSEVEQDWTKFHQKFEFFLMASAKQKLEDNVKIALLMTVLGDDGIKVYNTMPDNGEKSKYVDVVKYFENHCVTQEKCCY